MWDAIKDIGKFIVGELSGWAQRRESRKTAEHEARIAEIKAKGELAVYKAKADVEWDLTWAGQAQTSWKDEYLLILWSIPLLGFMLSLFIPGMQPGVMAALEFAKGISPYALEVYLGGWTVIFAATFGLKGVAQMSIPGKVERIVDAFSTIDDDIPEEAAKVASENVRKAIAEGKSGLF